MESRKCEISDAASVAFLYFLRQVFDNFQPNLAANPMLLDICIFPLALAQLIGVQFIEQKVMGLQYLFILLFFLRQLFNERVHFLRRLNTTAGISVRVGWILFVAVFGGHRESA